MCEKDKSLDDLFLDAKKGICSNDALKPNKEGLTNLTEGVTFLTHSYNGTTFETSEKHKK